jgi:glycosyltransferase involved in cell wall biosynthesis
MAIALEPVPLVSFVIPAYNHENFLAATLNSIQADPYPRKELIILDDGSQDQTLALARTWCARNGAAFERTAVASRPNQGICRTLNQLIGLARGEFIAPLASDDELVPGLVLKRVQYLLEHPAVLAVYGDSWLIDEQGRTTGPSLIGGLGVPGNKQALADPALMGLELILRWSGCGPGFLARRACYDPVQGLGPYDENLFMEDREYFLRLAGHGKLRFLDDRVARYRIRPASMCRSRASRLQVERGLLLSEQKHRHSYHGVARVALEASILQHRLRIKGGLWKQLKVFPNALVTLPLKLALDLKARFGAKHGLPGQLP